MIVRLMVALAVTVLAAQGLCAAEPVKITDSKDKQLVEGFLKHAENVPQDLSVAKCKKLESSFEYLAWHLTPYSNMPLTAYELTGDAKYLDIFVQVMDNLRTILTKGPDGLLGWYATPEEAYKNPKYPDIKVDIVINDFRMINQMARFVELTSADPAVATKDAKQGTESLDLCE